MTAAPSRQVPRRAAPAARRIAAQAGFELRAVLRNGEQLLVTIALPLMALVGLSSGLVDLPTGGRPRIDVVVPAVLAFAVLSASFTSQAIATAFDRRNGVLRLLATTPLRRSGLLAGKVIAVLAVEAIQAVVIIATGVALGWRPTAGGLLAATGVGVLGTAAFVALGLAMAGTLRAEAVLAGANLLLVALALGGGMLVPLAWLPGPLAAIAPWLPSGALAGAMDAVLSPTAPAPFGALLVLIGWTAALWAAVHRWFAWD